MNPNVTIKFKLPYLFLVVVFLLSFYGTRWWFKGALPGSELLGFILSFAVCSAFLYTKQLFFLLFYSVIVFSNFYTGDAYLSNGKLLLDNVVAMLISLSLSYYAFRKNDRNLMQLVIYTVFMVIIWSAAVSFVLDWNDPGLVRHIGEAMNRSEEFTPYIGVFQLGLSDYYSPHAIPTLVPPLVMGIRNPDMKKYRLVLYAVLVSCFLLLYLSGAMGPLLVGLMILVISIIVKEKQVSKNILRILLVTLLFAPLLFNDLILVGLLSWLDDLLGANSAFHNKIQDFQYMIVYGGLQGDMEVRNDLYTETIEAIKENVFLGSQSAYGGHSFILDSFSSMGILGIIPFLAIFYYSSKHVLSFIGNNSRIYYYLGIIATVIMLLSKNIACWQTWFYSFAVLPFCILLFSEKPKSMISKQLK